MKCELHTEQRRVCTTKLRSIS